MLGEEIAAGIVGVALLWLVLQPIVLPVDGPTEVLDIPDPEETPRGQALLALKEIEFDRATGKLSDEDFTVLHARYTTAALVTLSSESASGDHATALKVGDSTAPGDRQFCGQCGVRLSADAQFCAECGTPIR
jgi:hypothetical protein